ncbi:MAG TPA: hypothetical protein PKJ62_04370 [Bacteroidia bacterium]|nr:hypothetical protein [Bacteroidia bacterium]HNS11613.1 hypothetical protein [Bacteroidia bacterium]
MSEKTSKDKILNLLREKVALKQEVSDVTHEVFAELKIILKQLFSDLEKEVLRLKKNIPMSYQERGDFEVVLTIADDTLVFLMHTNVFTFEKDHGIWKNSYIEEKPLCVFCGKIYIYNFLSDSFKYNRTNDVGYLIARLFVNRERHFFVEGKRQLGFLFNDFQHDILNEDRIRDVLEAAVLYSLDFDPFTPPYDQMTPISVQSVLETSLLTKIATGKRLGFRFQADKGGIEMP